jgi:CRISPR-associated exonuclease Cas4
MDDALYIQISALEHYSYCPRQCGLIHVERIYDENVFTLRGNGLHSRVDERSSRIEAGIRVERALPLWSDSLGLSGTADVVEFHADGSVVPVEYKPGARPVTIHDDIQLCAQALCPEEMLNVKVSTGLLFSGEKKRRRKVEINGQLRAQTTAAIIDVRNIIASKQPLPPAVNDERCPNCSLRDTCMPETIDAMRRTPNSRTYRPTPESAIRGDG